jgi:hypothetical protein
MNIKGFKIIYWLPALSFWLVFQILTWQAKWLWWSLIFLLIINLVNLQFLPGVKKPIWPRLLIASVPAFFSIGAITYTSLLSNRSFLQFLIFIAALIIYQYWRLAYKKTSPRPIKQQLLQLIGDKTRDFVFIGVSLYVNFLAVFLIASSLLGIKYFLSLPYWLMFTLLAVSVFPLTLAAAEVLGLFNRKDQRYLWLLIALVVWQIGVSLFFLPLSYSVSGFLLALAFYTAINLSRFSLSGELKGNRKRWYVLFPLIATFLILFSASWL